MFDITNGSRSKRIVPGRLHHPDERPNGDAVSVTYIRRPNRFGEYRDENQPNAEPAVCLSALGRSISLPAFIHPSASV